MEAKSHAADIMSSVPAGSPWARFDVERFLGDVKTVDRKARKLADKVVGASPAIKPARDVLIASATLAEDLRGLELLCAAFTGRVKDTPRAAVAHCFAGAVPNGPAPPELQSRVLLAAYRIVGGTAIRLLCAYTDPVLRKHWGLDDLRAWSYKGTDQAAATANFDVARRSYSKARLDRENAFFGCFRNPALFSAHLLLQLTWSPAVKQRLAESPGLLDRLALAPLADPSYYEVTILADPTLSQPSLGPGGIMRIPARAIWEMSVGTVQQNSQVFLAFFTDLVRRKGKSYRAHHASLVQRGLTPAGTLAAAVLMRFASAVTESGLKGHDLPVAGITAQFTAVSILQALADEGASVDAKAADMFAGAARMIKQNDRDENGEAMAMDWCDACGAGGKDEELKRCVRCKVARYCSPACQKADWIKGHRDECADAMLPEPALASDDIAREMDYLSGLVAAVFGGLSGDASRLPVAHCFPDGVAPDDPAPPSLLSRLLLAAFRIVGLVAIRVFCAWTDPDLRSKWGCEDLRIWSLHGAERDIIASNLEAKRKSYDGSHLLAQLAHSPAVKQRLAENTGLMDRLILAPLGDVNFVTVTLLADPSYDGPHSTNSDVRVPARAT
ncbi:hypothetical protein DFJ74DRAFT_640692 [Hyaloraphidium curvatum]|nr:hypothetical protein DFJ74DRAFT_640692 [Hyaloraphidium curvatum]